jgi:hypothetical protein
LQARPTIISPFIADYVLNDVPKLCNLNECRTCQFLFFDTRYDQKEISTLYTGYRGDAYFSTRNRCEPWYTKAFNTNLGGSEIAKRRQLFKSIIDKYAHDAKIDAVLDYGGDRGQMIVDGPGKDLNVLEISGVRAEPGVKVIANEEALNGRQFDLVLLCGVLEHMSLPLAETTKIMDYIRPNGFLYVEVPDEQFALSEIPSQEWYLAYLNILSHHPLLLKLIDFWSSAVRVKFRHIPVLGFAKLHEHLNYFSPMSLTKILNRAGLKVLSCDTYKTTNSITALCQKST